MRTKRFSGENGRVPNALPALPEVLFYKGEPKSADGKRGKDLPYFRSEWPDGLEHVKDAFHELYGDKPTHLTNVLLLSDEAEDSFMSANESWRSGEKESILLIRCDGETISFYREGDKVLRNSGKACLIDCDCVPVGRLTFILKDLVIRTGEVVKFRFITHAKSDIERMLATLDFAVEGSGGYLRGVAFTLWREPRKVITPEGMTVTKHQVFMGFADAAQQRLARGYAENVLRLVDGASDADVGSKLLPAPAKASSGAKKGMMQTVILQPVVHVWLNNDGTEVYGFKAAKGKGLFYSKDTEMVKAAIPNIVSLSPDKSHPLDVRGFEATYDANVETTGDIFIASLKAL
jgi:hypothetical protein